MHYTQRIRALRTDHDLTQEQAGQIVHVAQRTYSDYESGRTRIPVDNLILLARFYNVSTDYISGVSEEWKDFPKK